MAIQRFNLSFPLRKLDLRAEHERLNSLEAGDVAELHVDDSPAGENPLDYGRMVQFIVSWGATNATSKLSISRGSSANWLDLLSRSYLLTVAGSLAEATFDEDGADVTSAVSEAAHESLEMLNGVGSADLSTSTGGVVHLLLPTHVPRLSHSPDLHSLEDGEWQVGEEARSLYHGIWPEPGKPSSVRSPWFHLGERRIETGRDVAVIRRVAEDGTSLKTLAERTICPRGHARDAAMAYRVRDKPPEDELGEVLFELVQNTQWHGMRSSSESGRSIRTFRFCVQNISLADIPVIAAEDRALGRYLSSAFEAAETKWARQVSSLLLGVASIIDSGPGLARSVAKNLGQYESLSEQDEIALLRQALNKTIRTSFRQMGNIGLPRVQLLLTNLRGFMTIRTGSFELRRDFINRPIKPRRESELFAEWVPDDYEDFHVGERVGTDVTLMVPIDYIFGVDK